ncbi:Transcription initiation factor TFIID subunit 4 [Sarracenia purpurea var. burkii]
MEIDDASNQSTTSVVGTTVTNPLQNDGSLPNGSSNVPPLPSNNVLNVSNSNLQGTSMFSFDFIVKISLSATEKHKFSGTAVIIPSNTCNNVQSSTVPTQMTTPESLSGSQLNTATVSLATMTIDDAPTILSSTPQTMFSNVQVVNLNARIIQVLQEVQGPQGGHLLIKTQDGKYQLTKVNSAAAASQGTTINQNATPATTAGQSYRIHTAPFCTAATATTSPTVQIATQGPQSGYLLFKTDDGKYQLLRVGTPVATPQGTKNQNATAAKIAGQRVSIQAVPVLSATTATAPSTVQTATSQSQVPTGSKSLPLLRAAMIAKELTIDGVRPPPAPTESQTAETIDDIRPSTVPIRSQIPHGLAAISFSPIELQIQVNKSVFTAMDSIA